MRRFPFKYLQALICMPFSGAFQHLIKLSSMGIGIYGRRVRTIRSDDVFRDKSTAN